jgi:hypothetical protein
MIDHLSMDGPITRREVRTLVEVLSSTNMYIKEDEYRRQIGMGRTNFYHLKKLGRFNAGTHPATLGCKKRLIHKFYNVYSSRIEIPGLDYMEPITQPKRRGRINEAAKKPA